MGTSCSIPQRIVTSCSHSVFNRKLLAISLLGRRIYYYEAYPGEKKGKSVRPENLKTIVLLARGRPCESETNLVLRGFMDRLTGYSANKQTTDTDKAEEDFIRQHFLVVVIPILNVDGVLVGNSRCSVSGQDLLSVWSKPDRYLHPEVYYTKKLIKQLQQHGNVIFFTEFRSDPSMKGCKVQGNQLGQDRRPPREFPCLLSENVNYFSLEDCK